MASQLIATFTTNHGAIVVELFPNHAPKTVDNFVGLTEGTKDWIDPATGQISNKPFYDGLGFHRIIPNFNAEAEGITVEQIVEKLITMIPRGKGERLL